MPKRPTVQPRERRNSGQNLVGISIFDQALSSQKRLPLAMILVANEEYPMAHLMREMFFENHLIAHQILSFAWHFWHFQLVGLILGLIGLGLLVLFWSKTQLPSDHFAVLAFALFGTWLMVGSALQIVSVLI
jgi:hypothetical protein